MRNDDRDVTYVEQESGSTAKWFLFGRAARRRPWPALRPAVGGADPARHQPPRREKLRRDAEDSFDDVIDEVETRGRKVQGAGGGVGRRCGRWTFARGRRTLERTANSARDELERRLADARARRRAAIDCRTRTRMRTTMTVATA